MNRDQKYARRYFGALAAVLALLTGLIVWGHTKGGGERDNSDLQHAVWCDQKGLSPTLCKLTE